MTGIRAKVLVLLGLGLAAGAAAFLFTTSEAGAAPTCTNSWKSAVNGSWTDSTKWSKGTVPTFSDDVCITVAGTYFVNIYGDQYANSITVGGPTGTQTLRLVASNSAEGTLLLAANSYLYSHGELYLDSTLSSGTKWARMGSYTTPAPTLTSVGRFTSVMGSGTEDNAFVGLGLDNQTGSKWQVTGDFSIDAPFTSSGTGSVGVDSTFVSTAPFTQDGGSIANGGTMTVKSSQVYLEGGTGTDNPLVLEDSALSDTSSSATLPILWHGSGTLQGAIPAGQTLTVQATQTADAVASILNPSMDNRGTIVLDGNGNPSSHTVQLDDAILNQTAQLQNYGTLNSVGASLYGNRVSVSLRNQSSGTVHVSSDLVDDSAALLRNQGTITIDNLYHSNLFKTGGSFEQSAGTLTAGANLVLTDTQTSITGGQGSGKAQFSGGSVDYTAPASNVDLQFVLGSTQLSGDLPFGEKLTVSGGAAAAVLGTVTNDGSVTLDSTGSSSPAELTNAGSGVLSGNGPFSSKAPAGVDNGLGVSLLATSSLAKINVSGSLIDDSGATLDTKADFTLATGAVFAKSGGTFIQSGGSLNAGSAAIQFDAVVVQVNGSGGTGTASVRGGSIAFIGSWKTVDFVVFGAVTPTTLSGTIPFGQSVVLRASDGFGSAVAALGTTVTNYGTITLDATIATGGADAQLTQSMPSGLLSNRGQLKFDSPAGVANELGVDVSNESNGYVRVIGDVTNSGGQLTFTNAGVVEVGREFSLTPGAFIQTSTGTLSTTVTVGSGYSRIYVDSVQLAGTLKVTTTGRQPIGAVYHPVLTTGDGTVAGTFAKLDYGTYGYVTTYDSSGVTLTSDSPFALTGTSVSSFAGQTFTKPVATVNDSSATPGQTFSSSILWGDGTAASAGTTSGSGSTRTISGTHKYTAAGSYMVTITVTGSDGTTKTVTTTASVIGPPTITAGSPASGPLAGGNVVTLTGTNFVAGATVLFSTSAATNVTVVNSTTLKATAPAHATGVVNVRVTTPAGSSAIVTADRYTYLDAPTITAVSPASGPLAGGNTVTITGTNFVAGAAVQFSTTAATNVTVVSATTLKATVPAHAAGVVNVRVTTPSGSSPIVTADRYTYLAAPTITAVSPASGPAAGGNVVTITGTNFVAGATVLFSTSAATNVTVVNSTTLKATAPAHAAGVVNVRVTTPGGSSAIVTSDRYTYQ